MLSQSVEVTDKWLVKWLHFLFKGHPSLVFSVDIQPVVLSIIVTQALEITNSICFSGTPTAFGIKKYNKMIVTKEHSFIIYSKVQFGVQWLSLS